ncbi:MAG: hypothetical protein IH945_02325 [Armatimonadetes bacterium]|nr:hypothetical protein [Armatimonadota bacterium]
MWQRFTERARKVVFYAQEEAQKFGEGYVSTEHLLLGLCRESDSVAARVLERLGVSLKRVRKEVEKQLPRGETRHSQDMALTPRAKRVIDLAYDEARNLNNNYIGTEHLLLGLIREGDGLAGRVLAKLGVELDRSRREVMTLQDTDVGGPAGRGFQDSPGYSVLAAQAIRFAEEEAALFESDGKVDPAHLLITLATDRSCAASRVLKLMQVSPDDLAAAVRSLMPKREAPPSRVIRAEQFDDVLTAAMEIAVKFDCSGVCTEHLLLALVSCDDPIVKAVLRDQFNLGVDQTLTAIKSFYESD